MENVSRGSVRPPLVVWVALPAALGFVAGFLGPVVLNPGANQGPLLGIFITGPGGAVLGLFAGLVTRPLRLPAAREWQVLIGVSAALVLWTLNMSLPPPQRIGTVLDAEVATCSPPSEALDRALGHWERRLAGTDARPGWQADARAAVAADAAVVLELTAVRSFGIYESRKPWNRGRLQARSETPAGAPQRLYARYAGGACGAYRVGMRGMYYASRDQGPTGRGPREWPPTSDVARFLGLAVVVPAPDRYVRLVADSAGR